MFKRLTVGIMLSLTILTNLYAINPNDYKNGSTPGNTNASKIITYVDSKKGVAIGNTYTIGNDTIHYYHSFLDEERDYFNLPAEHRLKTNLQLSDYFKRVNPNGLAFKYEHNPNVYDNPVTKSGLHGNTYGAGVAWDGEKNKWLLQDITNNQVLFTVPTDDKRGEWTINLTGKDFTGKEVFDKPSTGFATFRVHKPPHPKFSFIENTTTATLSDAGSYDIDFQYSKNRRINSPNNREYNGIKEFYWAAKIGENWVDVGKGPTVTFDKGGKLVTDYRLTVEDYDGAFASISKTSLILEKPHVDFEFKVGGKTTTYAYQGNVGNETLTVNSLISWNDEAFSKPPYTTSGVRTEKWTALSTTDWRNGSALFNLDILNNKFKGIIKGGEIPVELEAKNKYDYFATKEKAASVFYTNTKDLTGTEGTVSCTLYCEKVSTPKKPFMVATNATFILELNNPKVKLDEVNIKLNASGLGVSNLDLVGTGNKFKAIVPLNDSTSYNKALWDQFNYDIKIYSKRTGELLNNDSGIGYIHTPLNLQGLVNGIRDEEIEINTDDPFTVSATTEKYAEVVNVKLPMDVIDLDTNKTVVAGTKINLIPNAAHTKWEKQLMVSSSTIEEDKKANAEFEAIAYNKRDKETDNVGFTVISYRLENFRVVKVRDLRLEDFYKNYGTGKYQDNPMFVDKMAIDPNSFYPYPISSLTKGYVFEFEIDSINFNGNNDTIFIRPSFYSAVGNYRDPQPKKGYWIDSNKKVLELGTGGHSGYNTITLTKLNRIITSPNKATWRGQYFIPGTTFLTHPGTTIDTAKTNSLKSNIIVHFNIEGLKDSVPKFNYNLKQWGKERTINKFPYIIGDVIRYENKSNLDDLKVNRVH